MYKNTVHEQSKKELRIKKQDSTFDYDQHVMYCIIELYLLNVIMTLLELHNV